MPQVREAPPRRNGIVRRDERVNCSGHEGSDRGHVGTRESGTGHVGRWGDTERQKTEGRKPVCHQSSIIEY